MKIKPGSPVALIVFRTTSTLNYRYYFKFGVSVRRRTVVGGARVVSGRPAGRSAGRPAGCPGGARVVSGAEKKSFDRGGPVWPPRSNVTNDRLRGGSLPPQPKTAAPGSHPKFFEMLSHFFSLAGGRCTPDPPVFG